MSRGVLASVLASVLFAGLYYYATLLTPLTGEEIFGWRLLFTAPGATVLLLAESAARSATTMALPSAMEPALAMFGQCRATNVAQKYVGQTG